MGKKKLSRTSRQSSGKRFKTRIQKQLYRLKMKIARWKRYQLEGRIASKARPSNWDTSGLESHQVLLEKILKKA